MIFFEVLIGFAVDILVGPFVSVPVGFVAEVDFVETIGAFVTTVLSEVEEVILVDGVEDTSLIVESQSSSLVHAPAASISASDASESVNTETH